MASIRDHRTVPSDSGASGRSRRLDLDVVRGMAIVLALGWHFNGPTGNAVVDALQWPGDQFGWAGVDLFFVLSGFLMGRLVLGEHRRTGGFDGRRFTVRRILKLWPVLYLFLAVQALAGPEPLGSFLWQNALHVQNYAGTSLPHLWSLAVEEHFYLVLALLFPLFVRRRGSLRLFAGILVGILVAALALRITGSLAEVSDTQLQWRSHFRVDSLAAGVLLAVVSVRWPERFAALQRRRRLLLGVLAAGVAFVATIGKAGPVGTTLGFTIAYLTAAAVLLLLYRATWVPRLRWGTAPVAALGRYSYGIYIWHVFAAETVLGWLGLDYEAHTPLTQAVKYAAAIAVGVAATALVERPVLRLRDRLLPAADSEERMVSDPPAPRVLPQEPPLLEAPGPPRPPRRLTVVMPPELHGDVVTLRSWRLEDAAWYAACSRDPEVQRFTTDPPGLTAEDVAAAITRLADDPAHTGYLIADRASGERFGNIALDCAGGIGEVSYVVAPPARGRGVATAALELVAVAAFEHLGLRSCGCGPMPGTPPPDGSPSGPASAATRPATAPATSRARPGPPSPTSADGEYVGDDIVLTDPHQPSQQAAPYGESETAPLTLAPWLVYPKLPLCDRGHGQAVGTQTVRLGAWCDIETEDETRRGLLTETAAGDDGQEAVDGRAGPQPGRLDPGPGMPVLSPGGINCRIEEFAVLADGRRIRLHAERGFGLSAGTDPWRHQTLEGLETDVLAAVLPDDAEETGENHPWEPLVAPRGRGHGRPPRAARARNEARVRACRRNRDRPSTLWP